MPFGSGREDLGSYLKPKHAIASCSQTINRMLPSGEYERQGIGLFQISLIAVVTLTAIKYRPMVVSQVQPT